MASVFPLGDLYSFRFAVAGLLDGGEEGASPSSAKKKKHFTCDPPPVLGVEPCRQGRFRA